MNVADQLMVLRLRLKQSGWRRLNGNTWQSPDPGTWQLRTAYTWGEATLALTNDKGRSNPRGWPVYYRGAEPLTWVKTDAAPVLRKNFAKPLDTDPETE